MNLWYRSNGELSRQRLKIKKNDLDLSGFGITRVPAGIPGFQDYFLSQEFVPWNLDYLVKLRFFFTGFSPESSGFFFLVEYENSMKH